MTLWVDRILKEFPADLARLWVVSDPDDVFLDEQVLSGLRERGFEVLPFEDSVAFRAEYEERYRDAWDHGQPAPSNALVLHLRGTNTNDLPWDYLRQARKLSLGLTELFPKLSYAVVKQLGSDMWPSLFAAQAKHAHQSLGEAATKEFVLTHIFRISPHLLTRPEDLWRELLRLHYGDTPLPAVLAQHVEQVLGEHDTFEGIPIAELFAYKSVTLRVVQDAWYRYLTQQGITGSRMGEPAPEDYADKIDVPFDHHDVRVIIDSMFLDGTLHPLVVQGVPASLPEWAKLGVVQDPLSMKNLVRDGIQNLISELPTVDSSHRDWTHFSRRLGEILSRFHGLDTYHAESIKDAMQDLLAYSRVSLPLIPRQSCHPFHSKAATDSGESCHPLMG